ncbi:Membrane fusion protein (Multidrug efflux system) [Candidatus Methylobacter favarea]|uniref:Membrane fusion protein (Multidrug efflux system) n=1 Tax=Candidatus Methylobacter favarea TaxID=2707345 RepID=A0A8S0Y6J1_9GAMM|nr:HlyD family secretion protein [Candidatus Methylobacter favarea]CAA9891497.1 Membrane fusion protein (Multidrug efflux system) [Candidatus Methylobacter favarea]
MTTHTKIIRARRNRYLLIVMLILAAGALAYTGYWWNYRRFRVETDNAFVTGNLIPVEADATGIVTQVLVEESQFVNKGDLLVRLDEHRAQTALGQRRGELGQVVREIGAVFSTHRQMCQQLIARSSRLARVRHDLTRLRQAAPDGSVSEQAVQNAEDQMIALEAEMRQAEAEVEAIEAKVGGTSRTLHPDVEAAKYKFISAYLDYARQQIRAPVSGYVSMRKVQVGNRVQPGDTLMTLVPLEHLWVEANLRETEMAQIRPGQPAEVSVDLYGEHFIYHGTVEGLVPGTGSVFALLPPENAAGNFIHIVERVPVRIALRKDEILKNPLRPGLSTLTAIDIRDAKRPLSDSLATAASQEYETDIFIDELADAQARAQEIIDNNLLQKNQPSEPPCSTLKAGATKKF